MRDGSTALRCALVFFWVLLAGPLARGAWPEPELGERAIMASAHPLATEAGLATLEAGGNAIDAAVAIGLALSVVEPWASGLGGGAFAVVHFRGETFTIDMRETAPAAATADMFLKDGKVVAGKSVHTAHAAAIPGLVRGLAMLHAGRGDLPWAEVVAPAIALAREGFPVSRRMHSALIQGAARMNAAARDIFFEGGKPRAVGTRLVQTDLADVLERIAATSGEDFYTGETARRLVAAVRGAGGIWTADDLRAYRPKVREVVRGRYRGYDIVSMGPPSSGGLLLVQMLAALERLPVSPWRGAEAVHRLAEVMKRAFAQRALGLGDPDFVPVDRAAFIGDKAVTALADAVRASKRATPASALSPLKVRPDQRTHTTHFAVLTRDGDGVSVTQTINLRFGNGAVAAGTGIVLNNEMDDFSAAPGSPNAFGLVGDAGNAVAPGKRPLSSMTPTLVLKGGRAIGAFGSPGGSRIITTTLQTILRVIDDGMHPGEALGAERVHHQWYPDVLQVEALSLSPETLAALQARGHTVEVTAEMGNAMVLWRSGDHLEGAADPRGEGAARGW